jgi:hypothetical protein
VLQQVHVPAQQPLQVLPQQEVHVVEPAALVRLELHQKIQVAAPGVEVASRGRTDQEEHADAMPPAQFLDLSQVGLHQIDHRGIL